MTHPFPDGLEEIFDEEVPVSEFLIELRQRLSGILHHLQHRALTAIVDLLVMGN